LDEEYIISELIARIRRVVEAERRCPVILITSDEKMNWDGIFSKTAGRLSGAYINYLLDVLCKDKSIVIGGFTHKDCLDWIKNKAKEYAPLLITNLDPIITTWSPDNRNVFYNEFLHLELPPEKPVVIVSPLAQGSPLCLNERGQGIVLDGRLRRMEKN